MTVLLLALVLTGGCGGGGGGGSSDGPAPSPPPANTPDIPIPAAKNDLVPAKSDDLEIGLSEPLQEFRPLVADIQRMQDDGTEPWVVGVNRHLTLACADVLPGYSSDARVSPRSYIEARPRLLHQRYWRKVKQVPMDPGTSYSKAEIITYGTSTTDSKSVEFSRTIGVEVGAEGAWKAFSASVTASYEQTQSATEIQSVTFSEESTFSETYSVAADPAHTIVYTLWQLVDKFSLVDENKVPIHESPSLLHVRIAPVEDIEFPNRDVIYQSVTKF
jgi:hypothetical protein